MKVYVKRSDLLHFHRSFYDSSTELNTVYLTLTPRDLFLLAKIFCSFFTKEIYVCVQDDNQDDIQDDVNYNLDELREKNNLKVKNLINLNKQYDTNTLSDVDKELMSLNN